MDQLVTTEKNKTLPGSSKPQDFKTAPGYQTSNLPKEQSISSVESAQTVIPKNQKKNHCYQINQRTNNMNLQLVL